MKKTALTDAKLLAPILERWSPRAFDPDKSISSEQLDEIIEAARWAPSSSNQQPWRFLSFGRGEMYRAEVEQCLSSGNSWAVNASHLMVVCANKRLSYKDKVNSHHLYDTGAAVMSMIIQAMEKEIYSHQMGGFDKEKLRNLLSIPEEFEISVVIALGYIYENLEDAGLHPDLIVKEKKSRRRKSKEEIHTRGKKWSFEQ